MFLLIPAISRAIPRVQLRGAASNHIFSGSGGSFGILMGAAAAGRLPKIRFIRKTPNGHAKVAKVSSIFRISSIILNFLLPRVIVVEK